MPFNQVIDKVTRSVEEISTGISLKTLVLPVSKEDLKNVLKKNAWLLAGKKN